MIINVQKQDGIDIVALTGRFVMADSPDVRERLKALIDAGDGKLLIDMEKVSFIDSSACAVLISAFKGMQLRSGRLILVTSPVVQSLIELTRLHTIFEILPSLPAALGAFDIN
jgi:anti-sigma B factor antagonist